MTEKKNKFKIKITPTWFSKDYCKIKYKNGGLFWKTVKSCEYDYMSDYYFLDDLVVSVNSVKCSIQEFKNIDDIVTHNSKERRKVIKNNSEILNREKKQKELRKEVYNKYK